ncbi:MAG: YraN family protein [Eubacteriales bacterium]|nr:YraN family protein [Eubacteriales bacterium]
MRGAWGERVAQDYLRERGYTIVATNFRTRFGEIDMIAQQGEYLVFVEVKTRRDTRFGAAREHVTAAKQAKIIAAAEAWLQQQPTTLQPRFDVIEVYGEQGAARPPHIIQLENAFGG